MHNILLIDDDEKLARLLKTFFTKHSIELHSETSPSRGIEYLLEHNPELLILDVMLPEMNGFEVCQKVREHSNVPIIMLTARGDVDDRVLGLEAGADDYLAKPFEPLELVIRIENILGRVKQGSTQKQQDIIELDGLRINKDSYEVEVEGQKVDLTTKEYALLLLFVNQPGRVFSRDDIMNELSGIDSELFSRSVDILVSRLRNKLKPLTYIQTIWGKGYKFSVVSNS